MILARNCPHSNGIYTIIDDGSGAVIKSSYSLDGIARLRCEYAGYQWYLRREGLDDSALPRLIKRDHGSYVRLVVRLFNGRPGECYKSLSYNERVLSKVIAVYARVWPRFSGQMAPVHGDFSLGNLIIQGEDVRIIDWEHFHQEAAPWGFDLTNLLYECAFFSFRGKNALSRNDSKVFIKTRKAICSMLNQVEDFECTVENLTRFVSENSSLWGGLANKLPITKFSDAQKIFLQTLEC